MVKKLAEQVLEDRGMWVRFLSDEEAFLYSQMSATTLGPTLILTQWLLAAFFISLSLVGVQVCGA